MTDPVPIRAVERQRITRPHEVIEIERVVEFAARADVESARAALPSGPRGYDPERDSPMAGGVLRLDGSAPARRALPPGPPAPARWWRRWLS